MRDIAITQKSQKQIILDGVKNILEASDMARRTEIKIVVDKSSVPTISYKIDDFPILHQPIRETRDDI